MNTRTPAAALVALVVACAAGAARAEDVQLSEVAVRTLRPQTLLYKEVEITLAELGQTVTPIVQQLDKLVQDKKVVYGGHAIFVYHGATGEPDQKFKLHVGIAVADGTAAQGEFKVRKLDPFKCVTLLYGGPISSLGKAYEKLFGGLGAHTPTGETREYFLRWDGPESHNNVELLAAGIK